MTALDRVDRGPLFLDSHLVRAWPRRPAHMAPDRSGRDSRAGCEPVRRPGRAPAARPRLRPHGDARTIFVAFEAHVARIASPTACQVWTEDPARLGFAAEALLAVDLGRNPSAASRGALGWADVEVDDHENAGGSTGIGPLWPEGDRAGLVALADRFLARLPHPPAPLEIDGEPYERQTVVYHPGTTDPRAGRRYRGFHAAVVKRRGPRALVDVYPAMGSRSSPPFGRGWLDLRSVEVCDAGARSMTTIARVDAGALFLESNLISDWVCRPPTGRPKGRRADAGAAVSFKQRRTS